MLSVALATTVMATGNYRRVKAGKPKWIPIPQ